MYRVRRREVEIKMKIKLEPFKIVNGEKIINNYMLHNILTKLFADLEFLYILFPPEFH